MIHWQVTFEESDGTLVAQVPFQHPGDQPEAQAAAREFWTEYAHAPIVRAYPLCEVDENGCHKTDGQRLTHHEEHRATLKREALTLDRSR